MRKTMYRECAAFGFFFKDEQQGFAFPVGPFEEEWRIQFAKTLAQAFLQLFLSNWNNACLRYVVCYFFGSKKG